MTSPPTAQQLSRILEQALEALASGCRQHIRRRGEPWHLARDLEKLAACSEYDSFNEEDYWGIIQDCLEKAQETPSLYYKRPQKHICDHPEAQSHEMFAFVVMLDDFTREIYTKFCLKKQSDGTCYVSIDCHT